MKVETQQIKPRNDTVICRYWLLLWKKYQVKQQTRNEVCKWVWRRRERQRRDKIKIIKIKTPNDSNRFSNMFPNSVVDSLKEPCSVFASLSFIFSLESIDSLSKKRLRQCSQSR
ncbi:hypothetical protein NXS19_007885 [Fusarium pseudograminearum]|nr:hypothetical protein NXS19_007885 [Fusarium pseudograminearum]